MPNGKVVRLDDPEMLKVKPKPIQKLVDIEPVTAIPAEKRSTVISNDQAVATGLPTAQSDSPINQSEVKALGLSANSASIDPELQSIRDIASFEDKDAGLSHSIDVMCLKSEPKCWLTRYSSHSRTLNN